MEEQRLELEEKMNTKIQQIREEVSDLCGYYKITGCYFCKYLLTVKPKENTFVIVENMESEVNVKLQ